MRLFYFGIALLLAYLLPAQASYNMRLLGRWDTEAVAPDTLSSAQIALRFNEVWGWVNPQDGREYALIGSHKGVHIIDVSDPYHPYQAAFVKGRSENVINRDIKTQGKYAYAFADQRLGSLQVWDMSYLPDSVHIVYDDYMYADYEKKDTVFNLAHAIFIEKDRLYITTPKLKDGNHDISIHGLAVLDISKPEFPIVKKTFHQDIYGRLHALYVRNDTAYLNAGWDGALRIVDMRDLDNPVTIGVFEGYPYSGFNHTGWLSDTGKIYVMADETWGSPMKVVDLKDPSNPKLLSLLNPYMVYDSNAIAHNQFIVGQYSVNSHYYDGVQIYDISDPKNPVMAGYYDTYPEANTRTFKGCWGVYPFLPSGNLLASDMQTGLYILGFAPFRKPSGDNECLMYPNPAREIVHLKTQKEIIKPQIILSDVMGRIILEKELPAGSSFAFALPKGLAQPMYYVQILDGTEKVWGGKLLLYKD